MSYIFNQSSGGGNVVTGTVDFGHAVSGEASTATVTLSATWALNSMTFQSAILSVATADHGAEDIGVEGLYSSVSNVVNGVGFDVTVTAINDTWGRYTVYATGT